MTPKNLNWLLRMVFAKWTFAGYSPCKLLFYPLVSGLGVCSAWSGPRPPHPRIRHSSEKYIFFLFRFFINFDELLRQNWSCKIAILQKKVIAHLQKK